MRPARLLAKQYTKHCTTTREVHHTHPPSQIRGAHLLRPLLLLLLLLSQVQLLLLQRQALNQPEIPLRGRWPSKILSQVPFHLSAREGKQFTTTPLKHISTMAPPKSTGGSPHRERTLHGPSPLDKKWRWRMITVILLLPQLHLLQLALLLLQLHLA